MEDILAGIRAGIKALMFVAFLVGIGILITKYAVAHNSQGAESFDPVAFYNQIGPLPVIVITVLVFLFGFMTRMYLVRMR